MSIVVSLLRQPRLMCHHIVTCRSSSSLINTPEKKISFADHRTAYAHLSRTEILRAWIVLKLCSFDFLLQNSLKVNLFNFLLFFFLILWFTLFDRYWSIVSGC